jgi:hypothetical protein
MFILCLKIFEFFSTYAIAYDRQKEQDEIVKQSHFISVISDSSTDVSSKELKNV